MTNQPTRTPPTEPGDWEFCNAITGKTYRLQVYKCRESFWCRTHDTLVQCDVKQMPPGYWRRSQPLEPFAPQLPVVELWKGEIGGSKRYMIVEGKHFIAVDDEGYCMNDGVWEECKDDYTNLRRTHVCKWEACDANE